MNVLILSTNKYPGGDAGAVREETFAKLFQSIGCNVLVAGLGPCTNYSKRTENGIDYLSLRSENNNKIARLLNRLLLWKRLKQYVLDVNPSFDCIFVGGMSTRIFNKAKKFALQNEIKLIHDCVEWYSPEQFKFGTFSRAYREKNRINSELIDKNINVIAISSFLEDYFKSKQIPSIRIPVILDVSSVPFEKELDKDKIVFLYAGMPGKKDYLAEMVSAFALLSRDRLHNVELRLVGITKKQLIDGCGAKEREVEYLADAIKCYGRVPRSHVLELLKTSDFTVLLRDSEKRYAKAGFPTKVVESLSSATPVICNLSSDLAMYLSDSYNSLISLEGSPSAMCEAISRAVDLTYDERIQLSVNARKTAETYFDYKKYADSMMEFMSDAFKGKGDSK